MDQLPMFQPDAAGLLSLAITFVLPLVVSFITKRSWSKTTKGVTLLAVAFAKTILESWLAAINAGLHFNWTVVLYSTLVNFAIAVAAYFGLLKDTPLNNAVQDSGVKDS